MRMLTSWLKQHQLRLPLGSMQLAVSRRAASLSILVTSMASGAQPQQYSSIPAGFGRGATSASPDGTTPVRTALLDAIARGRGRCNPLEVRKLGKTKQKGLIVEQLQYRTEPEGQQAWVPTTIVSSSSSASKRPAVVFLHATGSSKEAMMPRMLEYAAAGYVAAAIDCRAWRQGPERPFLLDSCWDLLHLLDLLQARQDVDALRIGMTGVSLGGMHTWLCAAADERVAAAAPEIGVQFFGWAVQHDQWQGRVSSIPAVFAAAAADLGKDSVDSTVVEAVWRKIMPGLLDSYDAPASLPAIAPRPLLVANAELDPRCPLEGVHAALKSARQAYAEAGTPGNVELYVEPNMGHQETLGMQQAVRAFFDRHLLPAT